MARSSSSLELDFFNMEKKESRPLPAPPVFQRRRSFRDIQGVITKMNPEVVKSVIGKSSLSTNFSLFPAPDPKLTLCGSDDEINVGNANRASMTIFYNGKVSVFEVSPHKAHDILKVAEEVRPNSAKNSYSERNLLESLDGDLPISRRNSLQRFLEKRKERVIMVSPYYFPTNSSAEHKIG